MPDGPVIVNNTPLVALWVLGRLDLLRDLYEQVLIPDAVRDEFLAVERGPREAGLIASPWIRVLTLAHPQQAFAYTGLDQGEAAVLALAAEQGARLVIMDERKGRRYCNRLGYPVAGTIAILLLAKELGRLPAVSPALSALVAAGLYFSNDLIERALALAGEV